MSYALVPIHTFYTLISCIENTLETRIYKKQNLCDICSFIGSYFIHQHIYLCVKCVFNAWYLYVKCANYEWINFARFSLLICCMLNLWWHKLFFLDEKQIKCCSHVGMKTKIITNMTDTKNSYKNVQRSLQMSNNCM
jgi:hypothetical protein